MLSTRFRSDLIKKKQKKNNDENSDEEEEDENEIIPKVQISRAVSDQDDEDYIEPGKKSTTKPNKVLKRLLKEHCIPCSV